MKPEQPEPVTFSFSAAGDPMSFEPSACFDMMEHVATASVPIRSEGDLRVAWLLLTAPYRGQA